MTKIEQIEHFQTRIHRFCLLMPIGDFHHRHTLYIMYASRFKSPKNCGPHTDWLLRVRALRGIHTCWVRDEESCICARKAVLLLYAVFTCLWKWEPRNAPIGAPTTTISAHTAMNSHVSIVTSRITAALQKSPTMELVAIRIWKFQPQVALHILNLCLERPMKFHIWKSQFLFLDPSFLRQPGTNRSGLLNSTKQRWKRESHVGQNYGKSRTPIPALNNSLALDWTQHPEQLSHTTDVGVATFSVIRNRRVMMLKEQMSNPDPANDVNAPPMKPWKA